MASTSHFTIFVSLLVLFSVLHPAIATTRKLAALIQEQPLLLNYHNGPLLKATIVWWETTGRYRGGPCTVVLGNQVLDENYSLGKSLKTPQLAALASKAGYGENSANFVFTSADVAIEGFCMSRCGTHGSGKGKTGKFAYAWKIQSLDDIRHFHESDSGKNFLGFVVALSESIRGRKISDPCHESPTVKTILSILQTLMQWIEEIPPVQQASRYGNVSYRTWHSRLEENSESLMLQFLPDDFKCATIEVVPYFTDSFGNSSRIDYGTGHETNFAAWLYCLARMGIIKEGIIKLW
ncbi:hypothetical protein GH714_025711 [Hevea brasiliensis]|uniref:Serine/threonine-protein phosphatase 2A activator n=1 Tax=Hevea brasiliensis TaxID=3981 RepID=A0A6A6KRF0_HEVBR|nr:hypothetical protein GH714_025711 [Hevea brasiliensis]